MDPRTRDALADVPSYVPGKFAAGMEKMSSNENPLGPLPGVLDEATAALGAMNRYPDLGATELVETLSNKLRVDAQQIVIGTGSSAILQQIATAVSEPDDEIVFPWRSFESYPIVTRVAGATPVPVSLMAEGHLDLGAMVAAVTRRTRAVFVCSPNNPSGPAVRERELRQFLDALPPEVLVVFDEAYAEYVRDKAAARGLDLLSDYDNLCVLRTFSKAYGLAGLRIGYAIAAPSVAAALRKCAVPFGVSAIAQRAAIRSLGMQDALFARVDESVRERQRLQVHLRERGWAIPDAEGNFLWLPLGGPAAEFAARCAEAGLLVRCFPDEGVRVTIGLPSANDAFLTVADAWTQ